MREEKQISPAMKKTIGNIKKCLNISFHGRSFQEASEFISEHMDDLKNVDMREHIPPTAKMKKLIKIIEENLEISFDGTSMSEASEFIDANIDKAFASKRY